MSTHDSVITSAALASRDAELSAAGYRVALRQCADALDILTVADAISDSLDALMRVQELMIAKRDAMKAENR